MSEWINCSDRLPPFGEHVLTYHEDCGFCLGTCVKTPDENAKWITSDYEEFPQQVSHWMALPEGPK